jgi:hypothetical protein
MVSPFVLGQQQSAQQQTVHHPQGTTTTTTTTMNTGSRLLQRLQLLKEQRAIALVKEKQTISALQIAVAKKQKELDEASHEHFQGLAKVATRQDNRLPLWGLNADPDLQFLDDLRERRAHLYQKVGRAEVDNSRTYLAAYELHPQDLARQAAMEDVLNDM